jgi:hypothetical protein
MGAKRGLHRRWRRIPAPGPEHPLQQTRRDNAAANSGRHQRPQILPCCSPCQLPRRNKTSPEASVCVLGRTWIWTSDRKAPQVRFLRLHRAQFARNSSRRSDNFSMSFSSHCHVVSTFQPICRSSRRFRRSRALFDESFPSQNSALVFGIVARLHPLCRCQKHPCTKSALRFDGNTKSGLPVSFWSCRRNR